MAFQKKLKQTNTNYLCIVLNDDRGFISSYNAKNLSFYEDAFILFRKNLEQIKENRMEDLVQSMLQTKQKPEDIKELIDYVQIKDFTKTNLACYPSDEDYFPKTTFCLEIGTNKKLYFSYIQTKSGIALSEINFNTFTSY